MKIIIILALLLITGPARSMDNCTIAYVSNITNAWSIGTCITQTTLSVLQVVLGATSFMGDGLFYYMAHSTRVIALEEELERLQKEHQKLKQNEPIVAYMILDEISKAIVEEDTPYSEADDKELIDLFKIASQKLHEMAGDNI